VFLYFQIREYTSRNIRIKSTVYGRVFFLITGFHGAHVTIGVIMLGVCLYRIFKKRFSAGHHVGFEAAI
jgi:cytochrome c oxidase subunit 3